MRTITGAGVGVLVSLAVLTGCSVDAAPGEQSEPPTRQMPEPSYPAFEDSAAALDDAVVEQVQQPVANVPVVDDDDDLALFQRWVVEQYVDARIHGASPVEAEAQIAGLYDDTTLDKRAALWTDAAAETWDADFLGAHQVDEDVDYMVVSTSDTAVTVEWNMHDDHLCGDGHHHGAPGSDGSGIQERPDHWGVVFIETELMDGQPVITDFSHDSGCGCVSCTGGVE